MPGLRTVDMTAIVSSVSRRDVSEFGREFGREFVREFVVAGSIGIWLAFRRLRRFWIDVDVAPGVAPRSRRRRASVPRHGVDTLPGGEVGQNRADLEVCFRQPEPSVAQATPSLHLKVQRASLKRHGAGGGGAWAEPKESRSGRSRKQPGLGGVRHRAGCLAACRVWRAEATPGSARPHLEGTVVRPRCGGCRRVPDRPDRLTTALRSPLPQMADDFEALRRITERRQRAEREWRDEIRRLFDAGFSIEQISRAAGVRYEDVVQIVRPR